MKTRDRILVYLVGVIFGLVLLGFFQRMRDDGTGSSPRFLHGVFQKWVEESGLRNLPEGSPGYLRNSRLLANLATRPDPDGYLQYIWILEVDEGYPRVRVVEDLFIDLEAETVRSLGYSMMAADQILLRLREGVDLLEVDTFLGEAGMMREEFFSGPGQWLVQVGQSDVLGVPKAVASAESRPDLFLDADPRILTWR